MGRMGREIERGHGGTRRWLQHARASSGICLLMDGPTTESYVGLRSPPERPHGRSSEIGASSLLMAPLASDVNTPSGMTTGLQSVQAPGVVGSQQTRWPPVPARFLRRPVRRRFPPLDRLPFGLVVESGRVDVPSPLLEADAQASQQGRKPAQTRQAQPWALRLAIS